MKRSIVLIAVFGLALMGGAAQAALVTVDFSGVTTAVDITAPHSLTLDGITFSYTPVSTDTAQVDTNGISGSAQGGPLAFDFDAPATTLNFAFKLAGGTPNALITDALDITFSNGDELVLTVPASFDASGNASGSLAYDSSLGSLGSFVSATMFFSTDAASFNVSNISYDSTVPEPATLVVWSLLGGLGVAFSVWRRKRA